MIGGMGRMGNLGQMGVVQSPRRRPIDKNSLYYKQVRLLMSILPLVAEEKMFALKGGTAINLFIRNMPRLSVDIDLTYLPQDDREIVLANIRAAFERLKNGIERTRSDLKVQDQVKGKEYRLIVLSKDAQIKIELSPVLRGCVFPPENRAVVEPVEQEFGYAEIQVVSFEDLYAGKICAALDRQHPRDLFDIKLLFENEGLSRNLIKAFLVYLISSNRPISEILDPAFLDISELYENSFKGMTSIMVRKAELENTRTKLVKSIHESLTEEDRDFLVSFKSGVPDWGHLGLDGIENLPAVKWKLQNLSQMEPKRHKNALEKLKRLLGSVLKFV